MFLGSRTRPVRKSDNFTAFCVPVIKTIWDPLRLTALQAYMACYGDKFSLMSRFAYV
jgi:hypothetical protein